MSIGAMSPLAPDVISGKNTQRAETNSVAPHGSAPTRTAIRAIDVETRTTVLSGMRWNEATKTNMRLKLLFSIDVGFW
jgi:hypothetical protein